MQSEKFSVVGVTLGQYTVGERIGAGGMASVYRGMQTSLNREVAIKVLPTQFSTDPTFVERFKQEAISIASLRHPNILSVFDFGEQNGIIYMVTEFIPGGTLQDRFGSPWPLDEVLQIAAPLASALDHAHRQGIVHRDLKPANVLMTLAGEPILSDFGLARLLQSQGRLTTSGSTLGTPEYMAPEQAMGGDIGPAADIYAFGVLLYEMLTGQVPFPGETPVAVILAHLHQPPPPLRSINLGIPETVEEVVLRCLAKDPAERFPTASDAVQALEATRADARPAMNPFPPSVPSLEAAQPRYAPPAEDAAGHTIEYGKVEVDLRAENLLWTGHGRARAVEILEQQLARLGQHGWELVGSLRDPEVLQQGNSLRGATIRGAVLFLRRVRR